MGKGRLISHEYDSAGTYYVKMTAQGDGGKDVAYDTIKVFKRPEIDFDVDPKLVMLPGQKMHIYNFTNFAERYSWDFGDGSDTSSKEAPVHQYEELGEYTVTLTAWSDKGCRSVDSIPDVVEVRGKGHIEFPNAFTPSPSGPSDGYWDPESTDNDIFHPVGEGIKEYTLEIFNKWGERLFISNDFRVGWDGYYEGELMPQDVYIWKVEGRFYNGKSFKKMGDVTLLRNFSNGEGE
jgi:gliding motility-associated-like protein